MSEDKFGLRQSMPDPLQAIAQRDAKLEAVRMEKIVKIFNYRVPEPQQLQTIADIRTIITEATFLLDSKVPEGRYKSLMLTHLETAAMFAVKAITHE